mmetsp:Transcript_7233/g.14463  ORF Transcript_7233/g.14463 Transcript_7233/m.14463 type:complete len:256 (-) Transcript_7233:72-839(-)
MCAVCRLATCHCLEDALRSVQLGLSDGEPEAEGAGDNGVILVAVEVLVAAHDVLIARVRKLREREDCGLCGLHDELAEGPDTVGVVYGRDNVVVIHASVLDLHVVAQPVEIRVVCGVSVLRWVVCAPLDVDVFVDGHPWADCCDEGVGFARGATRVRLLRELLAGARQLGDGLEAIAAVERAAGQVDSIAGAELASHAGVNVRAEGRADLEPLGNSGGAAGLEVKVEIKVGCDGAVRRAGRGDVIVVGKQERGER